MTAKKDDWKDQKPAVQCLNPNLLLEVGSAHTLGASKYGYWNFADGMEESRLIGAALRHVLAHYAGESVDPESGLSHLAHAVASINMAYTQLRLGSATVDQPWAGHRKTPAGPEPERGQEEERLTKLVQPSEGFTVSRDGYPGCV